MTDNNKYLDDYGYPTSAVLAKIETWEINSNADCVELLEFCRELWNYPEYFGSENGVYTLVTVGWSGNESIIPLSLHFIGIECFTCCTGIRLTGVENTYTPSTE